MKYEPISKPYKYLGTEEITVAGDVGKVKIPVDLYYRGGIFSRWVAAKYSNQPEDWVEAPLRKVTGGVLALAKKLLKEKKCWEL